MKCKAFINQKTKNMNKKTILTLMIASISIAAMAQKEVKYEKMYYKNITKETDDINITVDNAVSTDGETKFKLKI